MQMVEIVEKPLKQSPNNRATLAALQASERCE